MRYIYYIIIILVVITIAAIWGFFTDAKVEFSKPAIVINDRIISEKEYDDLIKSKSPFQMEDEFIDSVIVKELLIQEAIKRNINKNEIFRATVEDFYEQSLIKILMDNQYKQYNPTVNSEEIEKYRFLAQRKVFISKIIYAKKDDIARGLSKNVKEIQLDFLDLATPLKFIVFNLEKGKSSKSIKTIQGFVVYKLLKTEQIKDEKSAGELDDLDNDNIREFIKNGKKEALLADWVDGLEEKAEIWRHK